MANDLQASHEPASPLVLLIDDYEDNRLMTIIILEGMGCSVIEAADSPTAIALAAERKGQLRLVITDFSLPGTDGIAFIQQLQELLSAVPIIVLTALSDPQIKVQLLEMGCREYLTKPCLPEVLQSTVARYL